MAGTRKPEKLADLAARGVIVRRADFEDPQGLQAALAGADAVLIVSTDAIDRPGRRLAQHRAAVAAAVSAGVKRAVYTSMPNPETSPVVFAPDHLGTEQALKASGLSWTILRNCWYADFLIPTLAPAVASGELIAATGEGGAPYVTREDCAQAAAAALASSDASNRTWNITGPDLVTFANLAKPGQRADWPAGDVLASDAGGANCTADRGRYARVHRQAAGVEPGGDLARQDGNADHGREGFGRPRSA